MNDATNRFARSPRSYFPFIAKRLPPDATHADNPPPIDDYFIRLFDLWFDKYATKSVNIDTLDAMVRGLVGQLSLSDTIGLGPVETVTLMPDGALEPLDVLRIAGDGSIDGGHGASRLCPTYEAPLISTRQR